MAETIVEQTMYCGICGQKYMAWRWINCPTCGAPDRAFNDDYETDWAKDRRKRCEAPQARE